MLKNNARSGFLVLAVFSLIFFSPSITNAITATTGVKTTTTAKPKVKVQGLAKLVVGGTVVSQTPTSLTVRVTSSSKNAKTFKDKNVTVSVDPKTRITKNGKTASLPTLSAGTKVKVFGVFNKQTGTIKQTRWIKVTK